MAGSRFAYVRAFELPDPVLPGVFMVVRVDGKGFHGFSHSHAFEKPNDGAALELMNQAARHVCGELRGDVTLAFGESDEYSFLLRKSCKLYNRRESKIVTHIVSLFTSAYVFYWPHFFPTKPLQYPPSFDGRLVAYPGAQEVRDYFAWRQADTHINNLYNTTFWSLVLDAHQTERQAHETLKGTISAQKNEMLFSRFGINYERLPAIFRKGTTIVWTECEAKTEKEVAVAVAVEEVEQEEGEGDLVHLNYHQMADSLSSSSSSSKLQKSTNPPLPHPKSASRPASPSKGRRRRHIPRQLRTLHVDMIGKSFWEPPVAVAVAVEGAGKGSEACKGNSGDSGLTRCGREKEEDHLISSSSSSSSSSTLSPPPTSTSTPPIATPTPTNVPPWEAPERTLDYAGLGSWALLG